MQGRSHKDLMAARESVLAHKDIVIRLYRDGVSTAKIHRDWGYPGERWLAQQFDLWGEPRGKAARSGRAA